MKSTHRVRLRCAVVGSAMLASVPCFAADNAKDAGIVRFKSGDVAVRVLNDAQQRGAAIAALLHPEESRHIVVQFSGPLMPAQRDLLAGNGLTLQASLGNFAHFATLAPANEVRVADLAAYEPLRAVEPIQRRWKLHSLLLENRPIEWAVVPGPDGLRDAADPTVAVYVMFHADEPMGLPAVELARLYGGSVRAEMVSAPFLVVEMPRSSVELLADEDAVQWIEPALPQFSELSVRNDSNRNRTGADLAQAAPYNLDGAGIRAFIFDGGAVRASHQTFGGRATVIDGDGVSSHATHVAGTVAGSGAGTTPLRSGMAPAATILSAGFEWGSGGTFLYNNPGDVEADYTLAVNTHAADIANNSIGSNTEPNGFDCQIQGDYGLTDTIIDAIVRGSLGRPFRIVWANGNERTGSRCDIENVCGGPCGDYYSVAPPAGAKNHLTVGALNSNDDSMTSFSSWGPTDDGRMKPDVSGPGCQSSGNDSGVTSSTSGSDTSYGSLCGTSMSSPTVTGLAALILQDFRVRFPGLADPRNSTLRALFAHTAQDLFNPGPDYKSGYGSVRVIPAIDLMRTGRMQESIVAQGETFSTTINVIAGSPLKVTIAWDDVPGTPNAAVALVNNLDLRLIDPDGGVHLPWTLDPASPATDAVRNAPNTRDNIEQVMVDNPMPGTWTVEIVGTDVPQGPQFVSMVGAGQTSGVIIELIDALPTLVLPGEVISIEMEIRATNQDLVPGSAVGFYRFDDGNFIASPMTSLGENRYRLDLPAAQCGQIPQFYFSATGTFSGTITEPFGAPDTYFSAGVGVDTLPFADSFDTDSGWTVLNIPVTGAFTGAWERGVPNPATGTPLADAEDSGAGFCFVTDNRIGNFDIDAGVTILTSPQMDASGGLATVSYNRWFYNGNAAHDTLLVEISGDNGATWQLLENFGPQSLGGWRFASFPVPAALATDEFRIRFTASDLEAQAIVEAAVDGLRLDVRTCDEGTACPVDWNTDTLVNSGDVSAFLTDWIASINEGTLVADFNNDLAVNSGDISAFLTAWLDAVQNGC